MNIENVVGRVAKVRPCFAVSLCVARCAYIIQTHIVTHSHTHTRTDTTKDKDLRTCTHMITLRKTRARALTLSDSLDREISSPHAKRAWNRARAECVEQRSTRGAKIHVSLYSTVHIWLGYLLTLCTRSARTKNVRAWPTFCCALSARNISPYEYQFRGAVVRRSTYYQWVDTSNERRHSTSHRVKTLIFSHVLLCRLGDYVWWEFYVGHYMIIICGKNMIFEWIVETMFYTFYMQ